MLKYFVFLWGFVATVTATDYCTPKNCQSNRHIACNNNGEFIDSCSPTVQLVEINEALKNVIIKAHNEKRNLVASGNASEHQIACRMPTMDWDEELAYLAELNSKLCNSDNDYCSNTDKFFYTGISANGVVLPTSYKIKYAAEIRKFINDWFSEIGDSKPDYITSYPESSPVIGHFTVMVSDHSTHVGCAAITFIKTDEYGNKWNEFDLTCIYSSTNMPGYPVYFACDKPAASCKTGTNPDYPNLCSTAEQYDVNKWSKCETCEPDF